MHNKYEEKKEKKIKVLEVIDRNIPETCLSH
jgi:hypothetical protein